MSKAACVCCLFLTVWVAVPVSAEPVVIGETSTIQSEILGEERSLMVHLPDGYAASQTSYPVLYLLDAVRNFHHHVVVALLRFSASARAVGAAPPATHRNSTGIHSGGGVAAASSDWR